MGLVVRRVQGNQVLYQANAHGAIFPELKSLIAKTVGLRGTLAAALAPLATEIRVAFVYGSVARQEERQDSDVDLMVLGPASFGEVVSALGPAQEALGREVNPTVFPVSEFRSKLAAGNHFLTTVLREKKLFILGDENELTKLVAK